MPQGLTWVKKKKKKILNLFGHSPSPSQKSLEDLFYFYATDLRKVFIFHPVTDESSLFSQLLNTVQIEKY